MGIELRSKNIKITMPESIGNLLKKTRESKGISLEEISERTRIPKKALIAIEEEKKDDTISPFYLKGFIRSYAKFLSISEDIVKEYLPLETKKSEIISRISVKTKKETALSPIFEYRKYIISVISGVILVLCIYALFFVSFQIKKAISHIPKKAPVETHTQEKIVPQEKDQGFELSAQVTSNNWIQVTGDGEILFKGVLKKGSNETWRVKKDIRLWVSDAGGISLSIDGKNIGRLGKKDEKRSNVLIKKDGIH